jgi:hypothetical protein
MYARDPDPRDLIVVCPYDVRVTYHHGALEIGSRIFVRASRGACDLVIRHGHSCPDCGCGCAGG